MCNVLACFCIYEIKYICIYSTDPFLRKELYIIKAPSIFATRNAGKTIISRTAGTSTKTTL